MGLIQDIGEGPVALDTVVFIYLIEENPVFLSVLEPLFAAVADGRRRIVTSALTLLEVLVVPLRAANLVLAERYEDLLTKSRGLRLIDIDTTQLRAAAHLRAVHPRLRTPDALQLAAAATGGCSVLLTNDRQLPSLPGLRVLQLSDYAKGGARS